MLRGAKVGVSKKYAVMCQKARELPRVVAVD